MGLALDQLGIHSPTVKRYTSTFVKGVVLGVATGGVGAAAILGSGLKALALQGVSELALKIGLPPPIANVLSVISGTLAGGILDPSSLPQYISI